MGSKTSLLLLNKINVLALIYRRKKRVKQQRKRKKERKKERFLAQLIPRIFWYNLVRI